MTCPCLMSWDCVSTINTGINSQSISCTCMHYMCIPTENRILYNQLRLVCFEGNPVNGWINACSLAMCFGFYLVPHVILQGGRCGSSHPESCVWLGSENKGHSGSGTTPPVLCLNVLSTFNPRP